jgi:uncharacterized protein with von Willebrand factor type A (vWA) domain
MDENLEGAELAAFKAQVARAFEEKAPDVDSEDLVLDPLVGAEPKVAQPQAVQVDRWSSRIADRLVEEWELGDGDEPAAAMVADAHTACFEPRPKLAEDCTDGLKKQWFNQLLESPDFKALHASTRMDADLSQIAAKQLFERFREYKVSLTEEEQEEAGREPGEEGDEDGPGEGGWKTIVKRLRSTTEAVKGAAQDVQDARDASDCMGLGDGSGAAVGTGVLKAFQAIKDNPVLRSISENAGRFRRLAKSLQRQKPVHGMDDVVGICMSDEIAKLVPYELMMMVDEDLEIDLLRRLSERQATCRSYEGKESAKRGPIMVLVDESGSMSGGRIEAAKGLALSLAWLARSQNRWCCLVGWSNRGQVRDLLIDPAKGSSEILEWCLSMFNGGTHPPLEAVPELFEKVGAPEGKTDVIWITDGQCRSLEGIDEFNAWRAEHKVRSWTVGIGVQAESFEPFSDVVTKVEQLGTGEAIVSELLSL